VPKGVEGQQLANSGTAQGLSNQLTANAANVFGGLEPTLQARASTPMGYTPAQKASINTAAQQSAGGSTADAVGQGGLYAARTRNAGAGQAAIGAANRAAGSNLSRNAVNTEVQNANLGQQNQRAALGGLQGLYGTELSGGENALGLSNQALQGADQSAANNPWMKILQSSLGAAGQAATNPNLFQ
jgi:hypothetical protein